MNRRRRRRSASPPFAGGDGTAEHESITLARAMAILFEDDLHPITGVSRHTIDSYKTTFRLLLRFLERHQPQLLLPDTAIQRIDASVIEAFLRHLSTERGCSNSTVNVRRAAIGAMAHALARRYPHLGAYCQSLLTIRSRKARQKLIGYFEVNELEAIFDAVDTSTRDGFRDLSILRFLYNTGARASEVCHLRLGDLRLEKPAHAVLHGKGSKVRSVSLWGETAAMLRAYLKAARRSPKAGHEEFIFIGRRGNALTRQGLYKIARRYIEAAARRLPRLERPELHPVCSFRHTTATHLLMSGASTPEIQEILGHASPDTTARYRAVNLDRKRQALERMLALRNRKVELESSTQSLPDWADSEEAIDWLERL